ncbi:hypothetical protein ACSQ67_003625 [Phaseolus vulgaris]
MEDTMVLITRASTRPFDGLGCCMADLHLPVNLTKRWRSSTADRSLRGEVHSLRMPTNLPRAKMLKTRA